MVIGGWEVREARGWNLSLISSFIFWPSKGHEKNYSWPWPWPDSILDHHPPWIHGRHPGHKIQRPRKREIAWVCIEAEGRESGSDESPGFYPDYSLSKLRGWWVYLFIYFWVFLLLQNSLNSPKVFQILSPDLSGERRKRGKQERRVLSRPFLSSIFPPLHGILLDK